MYSKVVLVRMTTVEQTRASFSYGCFYIDLCLLSTRRLPEKYIRNTRCCFSLFLEETERVPWAFLDFQDISTILKRSNRISEHGVLLQCPLCKCVQTKVGLEGFQHNFGARRVTKMFIVQIRWNESGLGRPSINRLV